ncbi:MAG: hypothetical protein II723_02275 [Oscillospiraceae bacterium]|nr:hypothetical protein [Oscillospiraceae bacterium]
MHKTTRKLAAVLISGACMLTAALPAFSCGCAAAESPAAEAADAECRDVSFTASGKLAALIEEIEGGACNLYLSKTKDPAGPLSIGERLNKKTAYYAFTGSDDYTSGKQCYIYAQGVYGKLFDELPLHGPDPAAPYAHSEQVAGMSKIISPEFLTAHRVMPGAYLRTTVNADGSYNGSSGHSMILLGYNREFVRVLEANSDGYGLIRDQELTYEQFRRIYFDLKGRFIGQIIQPTAAYYRERFGLSFEDFPVDEPDAPLLTVGIGLYYGEDDENEPEEATAPPADAVWAETTVTTAAASADSTAGEPSLTVPLLFASSGSTATEIETTETVRQSAATTVSTTMTTVTETTAAPVYTLPDLELHHFMDAVSVSVPEGTVRTWTSSDPEIAAVDETGTVTPGAVSGTAVITAETGNAVWQVRVTSDAVAPDRLGDFDGDGRIDAYDAQLALTQFTLSMIGFESDYDAETLHRADADGDGLVTALDASLILRFFTETTIMDFWPDAESGWRAQLAP